MVGQRAEVVQALVLDDPDLLDDDLGNGRHKEQKDNDFCLPAPGCEVVPVDESCSQECVMYSSSLGKRF